MLTNHSCSVKERFAYVNKMLNKKIEYVNKMLNKKTAYVNKMQNKKTAYVNKMLNKKTAYIIIRCWIRKLPVLGNVLLFPKSSAVQQYYSVNNVFYFVSLDAWRNNSPQRRINSMQIREQSSRRESDCWRLVFAQISERERQKLTFVWIFFGSYFLLHQYKIVELFGVLLYSKYLYLFNAINYWIFYVPAILLLRH
jgi:hypothetical protein